MSIQSRQAVRMIKFVAELKKNSFPNATSFAKLLRNADVDENIDCACSSRTIMRDIETLQKEYNAPVAYDAAKRGFYLKNPDWEFNVPILDDDILSMTLLGTRLASDILPEPLRSKVNQAIEKILTKNKSESFDEAMIESFISNSGTKSEVDPNVFYTIFVAWKKCQTISFSYKQQNESVSQHKFEPHMISFFKGAWYIKGYEYESREVNCYAIHKMVQVGYIDNFDHKDKKLIAKTKQYGLFETPRIKGITLHCDKTMVCGLYEQQKARKYKIIPQADGSAYLIMKPESENAVLRWVLSEGGKIKVLSPLELRRKVAEAGEKLVESNL